jgi:hypothetical protein
MINGRKLEGRRKSDKAKNPCLACVSLLTAIGLIVLPHVWPQITSIASSVIVLLQNGKT